MGKINNLMKKIFQKSVFKRRIFFFLLDTGLITGAMYLAFWCRFNGSIPVNYLNVLPYYISMAMAIKLILLMFFNVYDISWRFVSLEVLLRTFKALTLGTALLGAGLYMARTFLVFQQATFPRSVLIVDYFLSLVFIGGLRAAKRIYYEGFINTLRNNKTDRIRVLIIGAGSAGEQVVREMKRKKNSLYFPIGFVDDDPSKQKITLHGVKVLGTREDLPRLIKQNYIDEILIAMPSAGSSAIREIVNIVRQVKPYEKIKVLPGVTDLIDGRVTLEDIKSINVDDLLGRSPVTIAYDEIRNSLTSRVVLITGAGGSIGSELVKTVLRFSPKLVVALDIDETELFYLFSQMKEKEEEKVIPVVGDVRDRSKMASVFQIYQPEFVIHSAAYKHVPILEFHPEEAVKTNVLGTKIMAELALEYKVEKFVFISTDKAINPTSVMGASKRCCEEMLKVYNQMNETKFISVRFGNVLGSRGSVIPLFQEQIKRGGPVTITHPEMKRYFMAASEAVLLVLEAAAVGGGGEVFVLDMGEPVKIVDLAKEMIILSGKEPDVDIPLVFTGVRPGEKLFEEVLGAEEGTIATKYEKIYIAKSSAKIDEKMLEKIESLIEISLSNGAKGKIKKLLKEIIPSYNFEEGEYLREEAEDVLWELEDRKGEVESNLSLRKSSLAKKVG